jgi:hypothetical protein
LLQGNKYKFWGALPENIENVDVTSTAFSKVVDMTGAFRFLIIVDNQIRTNTVHNIFQHDASFAGRNPGKNCQHQVSRF